ncbi:MAG: cation transporter [Bacteroidales bacterium]|nr:MAG: cation transporter [Bacteroidales bacterium]
MKNNQSKYAYIEGWMSISINILLFALKYWAGIVSNSIAIIADAWHTLSDSISSVIVLIGVKISNKPADKKHPFGHGRAELIASVIIGVILAIIGFDFFVNSIEKLRDKERATYGVLAIVAIVASIILKELLAQYAFWAGKKTDIKSLKADGWHHRSDALSSVIILAGVFLNKYFWWVDGILGILVAVFIFYAAYEILKNGINPLIGEVPDIELINKVKVISDRVAGQKTNIHHIHIHKYGHHTEITFHIRLPKDYIFEKVHNIATGIEISIKEELNIEATIHMEPLK